MNIIVWRIKRSCIKTWAVKKHLKNYLQMQTVREEIEKSIRLTSIVIFSQNYTYAYVVIWSFQLIHNQGKDQASYKEFFHHIGPWLCPLSGQKHLDQCKRFLKWGASLTIIGQSMHALRQTREHIINRNIIWSLQLIKSKDVCQQSGGSSVSWTTQRMTWRTSMLLLWILRMDVAQCL